MYVFVSLFDIESPIEQVIAICPSSRMIQCTVTIACVCVCVKLFVYCPMQQYMHFTWSSLIQIIVILILLIRIIDVYAALVGLSVMLLLAPIQHRFMNVIRELKSGISKWTDSRIKLMNELLQGIRIIKVNAWEPFFQNRLASLRLSEMTQVRTAALYNAAYSTVRIRRLVDG
jgi:hypothetical protein